MFALPSTVHKRTFEDHRELRTHLEVDVTKDGVINTLHAVWNEAAKKSQTLMSWFVLVVMSQKLPSQKTSVMKFLTEAENSMHQICVH